MDFLPKLKEKRTLAPGLVMAGVAMILSKLMLKWLAPAALAFFGLYRVIMKKRYIEGAIVTSSGILLWGLLSWRFIGALLSFMMIIGVLFCAAGVFLFIVNKKTDS